MSAYSFVFLSTQSWDEMDGAGRPTHYLARELLARGERVLFVEAVASRAPAAQPGLTVVSLADLGLDERALRRAWFGLDPEADLTPALARALDAFESAPGRRVVVYSDAFVPFAAWWPLWRARGYTTVLYALDDFDAFAEIGLFFQNPSAYRFLVAQGDLVVAVSTTLVDKLGAWSPRAPVRLLRQGLDRASFPPPRAPRPPSDPPLLGFWGHVNSFNVDVALVEQVAHARPAWRWQLLGPVDLDPALPPIGPQLAAIPNLDLAGHVPHAALARYLDHFDVALALYPDSAFNRARDPLKVLEYLSAYKPVVAAHTPQLAGTPGVRVATTPVDFVAAVEDALAHGVDRAAVERYLNTAAWSARLDRLLAWLATATAAGDDSRPDVSAWYRQAEAGPGLLEYIARLDSQLDETRAFAAQLEREAQARPSLSSRLGVRARRRA